MNLKRCPNPEDWQDAVYYTLLARLEIEKMERNKSVTANVDNENDAKRRKPTRVKFTIGSKPILS